MLLRDGVRCHPKVLRARAEAAWFWACCIDYSRQQLTDGFVPEEALQTLCVTKSRVSALVSSLIHVGLLHREPGGVRVHDYLDHNDSAQNVRNAKRKDAERKRASARNPDGIQTESEQSLARARGVGVGNGLDLSGKGSGEGAPILAGQRAHRSHVLCGRVCLPAFVFDELLRKRGGDEAAARAYVDAWALRTLQALPEDEVVSEDAPGWWRKQWAADHAPSVPTARAAPGPPVAVSQETWAEARQRQLAALRGAS